MGVEKNFSSCSDQISSERLSVIMVGGSQKQTLKLKDMEEKHLHNLFLKNMSGLIEEVENPTPRLNPNSKCGGMATHAGLAIELGITRKKSLSPQMEAILIWCQCRTREYDNVNICDFTQSWSNGLAFCALIHNFFPNAFDYNALKVDSPRDRLKNYGVAFVTGEKFAGVPDFLTAEDMSAMVEENRIDPKMIFSYVQEVYRMCNELYWARPSLILHSKEPSQGCC